MAIAREQFLQEVSAVYDTYTPSQAVLDQLGVIDLTTVSAPSGMGKDTLILASGLHKVVAETIRQPRQNNSVMERDGVEYEFRGQELEEVLDDLYSGRHVQIGMGPGRDSFYGSRIANYPPSGPALIDVMTSQVATMRSLPFASVEASFVVAPSYEAWMRRLESRGALKAEEWAKRHKEAVQSLTDGLADERYVFVVNHEVAVASRMLRDFAITRHYDHERSILARNAANTILKRLCN
jgi:guanylate kinase